jgi:hypothetical protein
MDKKREKVDEGVIIIIIECGVLRKRKRVVSSSHGRFGHAQVPHLSASPTTLPRLQ